MNDPVFHVSHICSAFKDETIGSKVKNPWFLKIALAEALRTHDTSLDRTPGQHVVQMPVGSTALVSAGVARRADVPSWRYIVREHRGRVDAYAHRDYAAKAEAVSVVVYTRAAYMADPEVVASGESDIISELVTHVIVAVLAFAGPKAPLSPYRFVSNLAGGNKDALTYTADDMRRMATDIKAYDDEWVVVAD